MSSTCSPGVLCVRPDDVRAASQDLKVLVSGLDPDAVVLGDAPEVWAEFDAIERVIASAKLLMARRVEQAHTWPKQGFRSAVEQIAVLSGTSMSSARSMLATSKHIADLPGHGRGDALRGAVRRDGPRGRLRGRGRTRRRSRPVGDRGAVTAREAARGEPAAPEPEWIGTPRTPGSAANGSCGRSSTPKAPGTCMPAAPSTTARGSARRSNP